MTYIIIPILIFFQMILRLISWYFLTRPGWLKFFQLTKNYDYKKSKKNTIMFLFLFYSGTPKTFDDNMIVIILL